MNKRKLKIKVLIPIFLLLMINCNTVNAMNKKELETCSHKYSQQGLLYYKSGEYNKALWYWNKVLQITLKIYGENDSKTAMAYFMLGTAYGANGDYDKALEYLSKDLRIDLQINGEENIDVASNYSNVANIYLQKGDYDNSLAYYIKSLKIFKKINGENSFEVARAYGCIGSVYDDKEEYNIALEHYYKALTIFQHINNDNPYDIATIDSNMAKIYYKKMDYVKAIAYDNRALSILVNNYENDTQIAIIKSHIELCQSKMEKYATDTFDIIQKQNLLLNDIETHADLARNGEAYYYYRCDFFATLKKMDERFAATDNLSEKNLNEINNDILNTGIKAKLSEGTIYFVEDNTYSIQNFLPYLGNDWKDFYSIRKSENNELFNDGSLVITKEELRRRIIAWEGFLIEYPNFPENNEIKAKLNCYISAYLRSQYDFSSEDNKISAESVESFNNFLAQNKYSKFYLIVKKWNNLLKKNNYKYSKKLEKFNYKSPYKVKKYNENIFDGFTP